MVLNVRQIAQYPLKAAAGPTDAILLQDGGLGGPYAYTTPGGLAVGLFGGPTAIGGSLTVAGPLTAPQILAGSLTLSGAGSIDSPGGFNFTSGGYPVLTIAPSGAALAHETLTVGRNPVAPMEVATRQYVVANTVRSFNGRGGDVYLNAYDIASVGGASLNSPHFTGYPTTPAIAGVKDYSGLIANTKFVWDVFATVTCNTQLKGTPTAPSPPPSDVSNRIATTEWVSWRIDAVYDDISNLSSQFVTASFAGQTYAPIDSPNFTGVPTAPTAAAGNNSGQVATTSFVMSAIAGSVAGVSTWNTRSGNVVMNAADITGAGGAVLASPAFTGNPTAPTAAQGDNDTSIATTAFVATAVGASVVSFNARTGAVVLQTADLTAVGGALLASPNFTGTPTSPTPTVGDNSQKIATTAFVTAAVNAITPGVNSFNGRVGAVNLVANDVSAVGGAMIVSPAFTGTPTAPTPAQGNSSGNIATTAFVTTALSAQVLVNSFNGRAGAVTLQAGDLTGAGGALAASPNFSGIPTAPTANAGTNTTQIATTAFVLAAIAAGTVGVSSFNSRTGAVTLLSSDVTAAGGALTASPAFSGTPTAPTATAGTSTTQLATCAFVVGAMNSTVTTFNGRSGAVTLQGSDISGAGGALLASPAFTGTPTAPTALTADSSTAIATTAFVQSAIAASTAGVSSFNGRTGAVSFLAADISNAGGALIASPNFTGTPTAPTATAGTNTTQIATTAFVKAGYLALTGGTVTGATTFTNTAAGTSAVTITGVSPSAAALYLIKTGTAAAGVTGCENDVAHPRWALYLGSGENETGSNAGSNFYLYRYNDAGTQIDTPLAINRSSGVITLNNPIIAQYGISAGSTGRYLLLDYVSGYRGFSISLNGAYAANAVSTGNGGSVAFYNIYGNGSGTAVALSDAVGGYVQWTYTVSDRRLKSNIKPSGDALALLNKIKVHELDLTWPVSEPEKRRDASPVKQHWPFSIIADEIKDLYEVAFIDKQTDAGYHSIRELPLICALVKSVQQLSSRLEALEKAPRRSAA
jgi:hypothetical protein